MADDPWTRRAAFAFAHDDAGRPDVAPADRHLRHLLEQGLPAGLSAAQTTLGALAELAGGRIGR